MKEIKLSHENDGFSALIKLDKIYVLSNEPEYKTQVISISSILKRNYLNKHGLQLKKSNKLRCRFYRNGEFELEILKKARNQNYYDVERVKELRIEDYFNPIDDLNGINCLLVNKRSISNTLILDLYTLNTMENGDECLISAKKSCSLAILSTVDGLIYLLDEKEAKLEDVLSIFHDALYDQDYLYDKIKEVSFNCHIRRKGIKDVYVRFLDDYNIENATVDESWIKAYAQMAQEDFYLLCESYIKMGLDMREAVNELSVFTGKELPSAKELVRVSKKTMDFVKKQFRESDRKNAIKQFYEMENNPKIGPNNVYLLIDFYEKLEKIKEMYEFEWDSNICLTLWIDSLFYVNEIVNLFDCKVKNLIERCVRAIFQYRVSPNDYLQLVLDYYNMCRQLEIVPEKKIPTDVITLHDKYSLMMEDIENKRVKEVFKHRAEQNKELITILPESDNYTLLVPENTSDLVKEGNYLHHCVGSYIQYVADGKSKIFFLRKKNALEMPYVTIELTQSNLLLQAKGSSNCKPSKEDMEYIYKWMDLIGGTYDK